MAGFMFQGKQGELKTGSSEEKDLEGWRGMERAVRLQS